MIAHHHRRSAVCWQVLRGEQGEVCLKCDAVGRGFIYPEEVSAQVCRRAMDLHMLGSTTVRIGITATMIHQCFWHAVAMKGVPLLS